LPIFTNRHSIWHSLVLNHRRSPIVFQVRHA